MPTDREARLPSNPLLDRQARVLTRANAENMSYNLHHRDYVPTDAEAIATNLHDAVATILYLHARIDEFTEGIRRGR